MKLTQVYNKLEDSPKLFIQKRNAFEVNRYHSGINKLIISTRKYFHILNPDDIYYLKAESNYCNIVLEDNKAILSSKTLKHYAVLLQDFPFIRVHGSYLVNMNKIHLMEKRGDYKIILENGIKIPVSRGYKDLVVAEILNKYSLI